jgi:hypothetical protein
MNNFRATIVSYIYMAIGICFSMTSCSKKPAEGTIILTLTSGKIENANLLTASKSASRSEIVAIEQGEKLSPRILTSSFYSACSPEISCDGMFMIFSGQKNEGDKWQIWEMNIENLETKQLTRMKGDCTDPAYLPLGSFLFTSHYDTDSLKSTESIYTSNIEGTDLKRITYNPSTYMASHVLSDGRILTVGTQEFPATGDHKFMVMRPDGTKCELFYKGNDGASLDGRALETGDGRIVFIESEKGNLSKGNLITVSYNRPLHSRVNLSSAIEGDFRAVFPQPSGKFLVSYRKNASEKFGLYEFDAENKSLGKPIYNSSDFDILEIAESFQHTRPRKLPSDVNNVIKTGLIVCQDANLEAETIHRKTAIIEIMGTDSSMGRIRPAADGSFYLRMIANKPFRFRAFDDSGEIIQQSDWIWLRPNERRGCVGCHEDQDIVPDNHIPLAVKISPIGMPSHINKVIDEIIDTE